MTKDGLNQTFSRRSSLALTAAAIVVPLIGLVGWLAGIPLLASYGGRFIPMAPSTAICLILLSLPLLITLRPAQGPVGNRGVGLAGALVAAYGLLVVFGWLTGLPLNPDDLLFKEMGTLGTHCVGRMSPASGVLFLLSGISLTALVRGLSRERAANLSLPLAGLSGSTVLLTGATFSLGYALGAPLLYKSRVIPPALPTSISFLLLGGALTTAAVLYSPVSGQWYRALNDMQIGTRLRLGLGLILALVMLLGALAWIQTDLLWLQTKMIYDHPLQVRGTVGRLEVEVENMSRHVRNLFLARNDQEIEAFLQSIEIEKTDVARQFPILYDRYFGPRDDVITLQDDFVKWNTLCDETVRLLRAGKTSEAEARVRPGGVQDAQAEVVRSRLRKIDAFARNMADHLYQAATEQKDTLNRQLAVSLAAIVLLSLIVSYLLLRGVKDPLQHLTAAAEQFRQGRMDVRSGYASANEFGALSAAFNDMADAVQAEMRVNENAVRLAGIMLRQTEARAFCRELLKALIEHTGSQIAAVYLLNPQKTEFEHFESIGLGAGGRASFSAAAREGEFGAALATGRMRRITDIPEDTRFTIAAVSGAFKPREIITLPLLSGRETVAVISLANVRGYDKSTVRLLEAVQSTLTARMNGVLAYQQIQKLVGRLNHQNRELGAQKKNLAAQADELTERNTELEIQKRQLNKANRLKSVFLSNMSHELRTPLNSVIALSSVLKRRLARTIPEEEFGYLEVIERNGRHLLSLISEILDLSRIEAGREEISLGQFSVRTLVGECVAMLEPQAREKDIALLNQVGDDLPPVTSDPAKCLHILQNLIGNAVKFTETGSVEISARRVDDDLYVAVHDTGIGIAANDLPHIFDQFRQADESASRKYGGAGLGLAIVEKYAILLQGVITVESTPGQGSTFTLRLPLTFSLSARRTVRKPRSDEPVILVVEDNPDNLRTMRVLLQDTYTVLEAVDGRAGVEQARRHLPDLILMDLALPVLDGFAALAEIRNDEELRHIPVVAVTANAMKADREDILARGFDGYVSKPVEEELLKKTIREKMR